MNTRATYFKKKCEYLRDVGGKGVFVIGKGRKGYKVASPSCSLEWLREGKTSSKRRKESWKSNHDLNVTKKKCKKG